MMQTHQTITSIIFFFLFKSLLTLTDLKTSSIDLEATDKLTLNEGQDKLGKLTLVIHYQPDFTDQDQMTNKNRLDDQLTLTRLTNFNRTYHHQ